MTPIVIEGQGDSSLISSFDGFGCNSLATRNGSVCVHLKPKSSTAPTETHAGLVLGPETQGDIEVSCGIETARQLRIGSPPNPHEVGWLVWNYQDNDHFYYFTIKPNGWEIGKRDPSFPGGQRFLTTSTADRFPIGVRHILRVTQTGDQIEAFVDGHRLATYEDWEHTYLYGRLGLYCEDADVYFDSLLTRELASPKA